MKISKKEARAIMISAGAVALLSTIIAVTALVRKPLDIFPDDEPWGI